MPEIIMDFMPDGTVQVKTQGFKGKKCLEATKALEEALGGEVERKATAEMHLPDVPREKVSARTDG